MSDESEEEAAAENKEKKEEEEKKVEMELPVETGGGTNRFTYWVCRVGKLKNVQPK